MKKLAYLFLIFYSNFLASQENDRIQLHQKDYVVTKSLDTISENIIIKEGILTSFQFLNLPDRISKKDIISFKKDGFEYHYKKKRRIVPFDKKFDFLKVLERGEVNLMNTKPKRSVSMVIAQL